MHTHHSASRNHPFLWFLVRIASDLRSHLVRLVILESVLFPVTLLGQGSTANPFIQEIVQEVSRDSLLAYVNRLQSYGTRYEYSPQQDSAAAYLASTFTQWGVQTSSDWYSFGTYAFYDSDLLSQDSLWIIGNGGTILFSANGGSTWTTQTSYSSAIYYGIDMYSPQLGIVVGAGGVILRTTNAGVGWTAVASPTTSTLYSVCFANPTTGIIVGNTGRILRTTTGGASWSIVSSPTTRVLRDVRFISPATAIAVGDSGYVLRSTDLGLTWQKQSMDIPSYLYSTHFLNGQSGFLCGSASTLRKTTDGGTTWTGLPYPSTPARTLRGVLFADDQRGWVIENNARIMATTDGGQSWQVADSLISSGWGPYFYRLRGLSGRRLLVAGSRSLAYTSTDNGTVWTNYSGAIPVQFYHSSRNIVATIPGQTTPEKECVIVAHYDSYSSNPYVAAPGANDNATGTAAVLEAARVFSKYRFASTVKLVAVSAEEFGMYGSEHYAYTARRENRNIVAAVNGDMLGYPLGGDTLHIAVGSYLSRNRLVDSAVVYNQRYGIGLNLVTMVDSTGASDYGPFALVGYDALDVAEGTANEIWGGADPYYHTPNDSASKLHFGLVRRASQLMLATGAELAGVLGRSNSTDNGQGAIPSSYALKQNYPNPFNPSTTLSFELSALSSVDLRVYDLLGREVAMLVDEDKPAGRYSSVWDAKGMPSGIYFYTLRAGDFRDTKRMILIK